MLFLFSKFKLRKWKKYSAEKRFNILRALEKKVARWLEIEPIKLEIKEDSSHWNCYGAFTIIGDKRLIYINDCLIYEPRCRFHALETIAHETRHAYQYSLINRDLKWYEFRAKKWKRNWMGYFNSSADSVMYNNQSIERDAQKYSLKILKKYQGKYGGEADFKQTFYEVQHRYEQADIDARKKYGFFYKHKIEKNIKDRSNY